MKKFKIWFKAVRAYSFTASLVPMTLGLSLCVFFGEKISIFLFPLILIAGLLFHIGTNLLNDYYDFIKGIDNDEKKGSGVLFKKMLKPKEVLLGGILSFLVGTLIGIYFIYLRGIEIFIIGLIGLIGGLFYTGKPFGFKYIAMGEVLVFLLMGPLMVLGSYFVLSGNLNYKVILISLPIAFLVSLILYANNLRDYKNDKKMKIFTLANIFSIEIARKIYIFIFFLICLSLSYLSILFQKLSILISLFILIGIGSRDIKKVIKGEIEDNLVENVAKTHFLFGFIYTIIFFF